MSSRQHYATVQGTITADPELKRLENGCAVVNISLAFNPRTYNRDSGEWVKAEQATFFNCSAFGDLAEGIAAHPDLRQGALAIGYGRVSTRAWEDRNGGGKRTRDEYILDSLGPDVTFYARNAQQNGGQVAGSQQQGSQWGSQQQGSAPAGQQWGGAAQQQQQGSDPWASSQPQQSGGQWGQNPNAGGGQWGQ